MNEGTITLAGICGVEEVEALVNYLESQSEPSVDLSAVQALHTALWQALMVFRPKLVGIPESATIANAIVPAFKFVETNEH
jgi:hypothetical protein